MAQFYQEQANLNDVVYLLHYHNSASWLLSDGIVSLKKHCGLNSTSPPRHREITGNLNDTESEPFHQDLRMNNMAAFSDRDILYPQAQPMNAAIILKGLGNCEGIQEYLSQAHHKLNQDLLSKHGF